MGSWLGHAAPGTFFIVFAVWWLVKALHDYYARPGRYVNTMRRHCCCRRGCFSNAPLDTWLLLVAATSGVVMEIATSVVPDGVVVLGNQQHLTMYISYGLAGLVSLLIHYQVKFVPKGADYMALLVALGVETVLFAYHLHGRAPLDVHVHMLLVYTIAACLVAVAVEMRNPKSINAGVARCYFFMLQGTWFYQIAFTLYPPSGVHTWDFKDMENIMLITLVFAWHMIGCLMVLLIIGGVTYWCCSPKCRGDYEDDEAGVNLLPLHSGKDTHHGQSAVHKHGYTGVQSEEEEDDNLFSVPIKSPN